MMKNMYFKSILVVLASIFLSLSCKKVLHPVNPGAEEHLDGYFFDDFGKLDSLTWRTPTNGATVALLNGAMQVTMSGTTKFRGDIQRVGGAVLNISNYPIIAVKMAKPPKSNFFFDTNLGAFDNRNNNHTVIKMASGNVYYWDLSKGKLGSNALPLDSNINLSLFQFKVADVELTAAQLANRQLDYPVYWVGTFKSVEDLRQKVGAPNPAPFQFTAPFKHPGMLHTMADLNHIRSLVADQKPNAYACYQLLAANGRSSASFTMAGPFTKLTRDASQTVDGIGGGAVKSRVENDFLAAYYNALMWNITGNVANAQKSIEIIDAYASTTTGIIGGDAELNGLYGFILANAAEIMRSTYPQWPTASIQRCGTMLKQVFYPTLQNFRPYAHGNWDIICMKALMAIAIFTEDREMINRVVTYFYHGEGNGSIDNYVVSTAGQLQESNRDQPHTMLALGSLAELAEMAYHQGIDLYKASNNALMRGYEYTANYNLGNEVPYVLWYDYGERNYQDYTPEAISPKNRGNFRSVFEIAFNHYVHRKGLAMPFTSQVLQDLRPEGAPFGADHPGYGTLLFNRWE
ncbi:DUF4979 domain-containing protein [Olivibacter sp. SA151]|uniref:DUF4979 domain-containing protein n=1 Tax=Olivibacter jilunii TaxID=985016 RepID=UPI003F17EA0C